MASYALNGAVGSSAIGGLIYGYCRSAANVPTAIKKIVRIAENAAVLGGAYLASKGFSQIQEFALDSCRNDASRFACTSANVSGNAQLMATSFFVAGLISTAYSYIKGLNNNQPDVEPVPVAARPRQEAQPAPVHQRVGLIQRVRPRAARAPLNPDDLVGRTVTFSLRTGNAVRPTFITRDGLQFNTHKPFKANPVEKWRDSDRIEISRAWSLFGNDNLRFTNVNTGEYVDGHLTT